MASLEDWGGEEEEVEGEEEKEEREEVEEQSSSSEEVEGHLVVQTESPRCVCFNFVKSTGYFSCHEFIRSYVL